MLRSLKEIINYKIQASDGSVGTCKDIILDDRHFTVRYIEVDTAGWLTSNRVLLSPLSVTDVSWESKTISTSLSKKEVENAPNLKEDAPISKKWEDSFAMYYGFPHYTIGTHVWGEFLYPGDFLSKSKTNQADNRKYNPNLRSVNDMVGYSLSCEDGEFGSVRDFIFKDENWEVLYFVVNIAKWRPSKDVILPTEDIESIDWESRHISLSRDKKDVTELPSFDKSAPVNKELEYRLYDYYGKPHHWNNLESRI